jgi:hypothetical protein
MYPDLTKIVLDTVRAVPGILPYLSDDARLYVDLRARATKADGDLSSISADYHDEITAALLTYLEGGSATGPRNRFKRAAIESLGDAFDLGYSDGGGELPVDGDALEWLNARIEQEMAHIAMVFEEAKALRKEEDFDALAWASARADGYTRTVAALYNAGGMYAKKNQILTWHLGNTEKHCQDCAKLDGKSHKASWYLARNYIPRQPGASMACGGYFCDCHLEDKDGNEVTI